MNQSTDQEYSTRSGLDELKAHGYMQHYPVYIKGKVDHWEYVVCESPFTEERRIKSEIIDLEGNSSFNYGNRTKEKQERNAKKKLDSGNQDVGHAKLDGENLDIGNLDREDLDRGKLDVENLDRGNQALIITNNN